MGHETLQRGLNIFTQREIFQPRLALKRGFVGALLLRCKSKSCLPCVYHCLICLDDSRPGAPLARLPDALLSQVAQHLVESNVLRWLRASLPGGHSPPRQVASRPGVLMRDPQLSEPQLIGSKCVKDPTGGIFGLKVPFFFFLSDSFENRSYLPTF